MPKTKSPNHGKRGPDRKPRRQARIPGKARKHIQAITALIPPADLAPRINGPAMRLLTLIHTPASYNHPGLAPHTAAEKQKVHAWKVHARAQFLAALPQFPQLDDWLKTGTPNPVAPPMLLWQPDAQTYLYDGDPLDIPKAASLLLQTYLDTHNPGRPKIKWKHDFPVLHHDPHKIHAAAPVPQTYQPARVSMGVHVAIITEGNSMRITHIASTHPIIVTTHTSTNNLDAYPFLSKIPKSHHHITEKD